VEIQRITCLFSSAKDKFLCTNVSLSSLELVLERLADRRSNFVEEEQAVASIISKVEGGSGVARIFV